MEFKLLVAEHDGQVYVWTDLSQEIRDAIGDVLQEHTFTMRTPLQERHRQEFDRLMWRSGAYDESMRWAATAVAYLQSWSLPQPLTLDGFASLHPSLATMIGLQASQRVFPDASQNPFFVSLLNARQQTSAEPA